MPRAVLQPAAWCMVRQQPCTQQARAPPAARCPNSTRRSPSHRSMLHGMLCSLPQRPAARHSLSGRRSPGRSGWDRPVAAAGPGGTRHRPPMYMACRRQDRPHDQPDPTRNHTSSSCCEPMPALYSAPASSTAGLSHTSCRCPGSAGRGPSCGTRGSRSTRRGRPLASGCRAAGSA